MPDAKSLFPEDHPLYMGYYWGCISSPKCAEIIESSDMYIYCGPVFNDYTTTGWTALISSDKLIEIGKNYSKVANRLYSDVQLREVLKGLIRIDGLPKRDATILNFNRYHGHNSLPTIACSNEPLQLHELQSCIQTIITPTTDLIVETGDR